MAFLLSINVFGQTTLEFAKVTGDNNPAGNGPVVSTTINFVQNTTGNVFTLYDATPLSATISFVDQQYDAPAVAAPPGSILMGHSGTAAEALFTTGNWNGSPANANFTSTNSANGTGISITNNYVLGVRNFTRAIGNTFNLRTRVYVGRMEVVFNRATTNPIIHVSGLGGNSGGTIYYATNLDLNLSQSTPNTGITLQRLSGSTTFGLNGGVSIANNFNSSFDNASGSVRIIGTNITKVSFDLYLDGADSNTNTTGFWGSGNDSGDAFDIGFSAAEPSVVATNDVFGVVRNATSPVSLLANDTYNGGAAASNVTISAPSLPAGFTLNPNGTVNIANTVGYGTYSFDYTICDNGNPGLCRTANATFIVDIDSDGDGIVNTQDLDDDNDGILDTVECPPVNNITNGTFAGNITGWSTTGTGWIYSAANGQTAINENDSPAGATIFQSVTNLSYAENGIVALNLRVGSQDNAHLAGTTSALEILLNGTVYATLRNGTLRNTSNISIEMANGATSNFTTFGTTGVNGFTFSTPFTINIPYTGPNTAALTFRMVSGPDDWGLDDISINASFCDTDGDGIRNSLDLDSDNDGCSDAIEGASTTIGVGNLVNSSMPGGNSGATSGSYNQPVIQNLGNTVNNTAGSASYGVPTIAGTGQGIGQSQNTNINDCFDSDGDNIPDYADLDDDNDGILDAIESPGCFYNIVEANQIVSVISPLNGAAGDPQAGTNITTLFNTNTNDTNPFNFVAGQALVSGAPIFTIQYPTPVALATMTVSQSINGISTTAFGRLFGSTDGVNYTLLTTATNAVSLSPATVTFNNTSTTPYLYYQIRYTGTNATNTTSGTTGTAAIQEIASVISTNVVYNPSANPKPGICGVDTDGDGIPNHLDLDSDNDGCVDALEGTGNFTAAQLTTASGTIATQTPNQNFGTAVNTTTGIPTVAGAGQGFGFSQNANVKVCLDSDNDGIADIYDLDDDNDGITDAAECGGGAIFNYTGFGIQATSGTQSDLYGFTGVDNTPVLIATNILSGAGANHLATDTARRRVIFTNGAAQGAISAYDFTTQTISTISTATFLSTLGTSSGGGAMYNGDYYIYDDTDGTANEGLYRITFDAAGTASSVTRIAESAVGADLGDLAISPLGVAYIISSGSLYKLDLTAIYSGAPAPSSSWILVGTASNVTSSQLFFRANGDLIGSNSGSLVKINPNTAANEGTVTTLTGFTWNDLSEGPTIGFVCGTDTDGDGIPNHLDLDSDNDGCPDAVEGGGPYINSQLVTATGPISTQTTNRNLGNTVGSTPVTLGIPTIAGAGQTIGSSQNAAVNDCLDTDGDGIPDLQDLDDDNDGILDAVESPACFYTAAEVKSMITGITSQFPTTDNFNLLYNGVTETSTAAGFNFTTAVTAATNVSGSNLFTITFNDPVELATLTLTDNISSTAAARAQLFGSNNNLDFVQLSNTAGGVNINTGTGATFTVAQNAAKYKYYKIQTTVAGAIATTDFIGEFNFTLPSTYIPSEYPKPGICSADTDGDGIPNHRDLDSDGDGCTDALEGGNPITASSLVTVTTGPLSTQTPNQNLGNTVGNTATTLGVPTVATTGQSIGDSQNLGVNDCLDSDGDGIPDGQDVDDDNDGILDTVECSNTVEDMYAKALQFLGNGTGGALRIVPSDFNLALGVKNQTVTRDLSAKFGYPANSGALIITLQNASVHPSNDAFWTKDGEAPSIWNVSGKLSAFILMAQNNEYYGQDSKTIHLYDGSTVIPFNLTGFENQGATADWSVTETASVKTLRSLKPEQTSVTAFGNWRFANMNFGAKRFGFSTTTRFANPTYEVIMYLECDSDMDGIPNRLDLDSDADGCSDALEGGANILSTQLLQAGGTVNGGSTSVTQNICTTCVSTGGANIGLPQFTTLPTGYSNATGQTVGDSQNGAIGGCYCTQPPTAGTGEITRVGISVQQKQANWPENIPNGHIALESKEKGLVITRVAHVSFVPQATDSIASPFAGMLVYDIQDACVKLFNGINWKCLERSCNTASN